MSVLPLKKGDKVVMHTCMEAEFHNGEIWTVKTDERKLHESHNHTVVWLEGYSGCFSTEYLQKVNTQLYTEQELDILRNWGFIASTERPLSEEEKELYFKITDA